MSYSIVVLSPSHWLLRNGADVYYSNIVFWSWRENMFCQEQSDRSCETLGSVCYGFSVCFCCYNHLAKNDRLLWSILAFHFQVNLMDINSIDSLVNDQLIICKLYLSGEYLPLKHSPNLAFWQITALLVKFIQCGFCLIGIQMMSLSRCSSKKICYDSITILLGTQRFQNDFKADYPPPFLTMLIQCVIVYNKDFLRLWSR